MILLTALLGMIAVSPPALAQSAPAAGLDENTRLMQEYMARRAEWLNARRATLDKVKVAKNDKEKKQQLDQLAEDEKPLLAKMGDAARAYQAAEKAKRDSQAASKPRG